MVEKKFLILLAALLIFFALSTQFLVPAMASVTFEEITVTNLSLSVKGYGVFEIKVARKDVYKGGVHYVKVNATCRAGQYYVKIETTEYYAIALDATGNLISPAAIPSEYKYWWDDILFVKSPGPSNLWIKYDHPDVYDTYNIGVNEWKSLKGDQKIHTHIPQYVIETAKANNNLSALVSAITHFILAVLAIPKVGLIAAVIGAVIITALVVINRAIDYFLNVILQDERGGGWMWIWGTGGWWIFRWFYISFGAWRDWGWFVSVIGGGGGGPCLMR